MVENFFRCVGFQGCVRFGNVDVDAAWFKLMTSIDRDGGLDSSTLWPLLVRR